GWLDQQDQPHLYQQSMQEILEHQQFIDFVLDYRNRFATLYASNISIDDMRAQKHLLQDQMRQLWREQGGDPGGRYQGWFQGPLNNAQLATVGSYYEWLPAFEALFARSGNDFAVFYLAVADIASLTAEARQHRLAGLMSAH
ncbi:MAG: aminopeptidase, partial [Pseudohongiella sp.]